MRKGPVESEGVTARVSGGWLLMDEQGGGRVRARVKLRAITAIVVEGPAVRLAVSGFDRGMMTPPLALAFADSRVAQVWADWLLDECMRGEADDGG